MLKSLASVLHRGVQQSSVAMHSMGAVQGLEAARGFAIMALQQEQLPKQHQQQASSIDAGAHRQEEQVSPMQQQQQQAHQLQARRGMAYGYARIVEDKDYVQYENTLTFQQTQLMDYLIKTVPKYITFGVSGPAQSSSLYQEPTIYTTPEHLLPLCYFLRDHVNTQFKCLVDITAVDFPERAARFEVVYHLLSPRWNNRLRIKVCVDELTPVPTIVNVYNAANWFERETWDMFGVFFTGHPDLRRILTDYGFTGHPLRKDFPLTGYTEVRYDYGKKRVITEPLELSQEFRYFDFSSPWETLNR